MKKGPALSERSKSNGFTLIEVIIAAVILVMAGVAGILAEKSYIQSSSLSKHKLEATGLAQEGISAVKKQFTSNLLGDGDAWDGLDSCPDTTPCGISLAPGSDTVTTSDGITFTRTITIEPPAAP